MCQPFCCLSILQRVVKVSVPDIGLHFYDFEKQFTEFKPSILLRRLTLSNLLLFWEQQISPLKLMT